GAQAHEAVAPHPQQHPDGEWIATQAAPHQPYSWLQESPAQIGQQRQRAPERRVRYLLAQKGEQSSLMPDDLLIGGFGLATVLVPGHGLRLIFDSPAGLQRAPQEIVVSPSRQGASQVERLIEPAQLQGYLASDRVGAAAPYADRPSDKWHRPPMERFGGMVGQPDPPATPGKPSVQLEQKLSRARQNQRLDPSGAHRDVGSRLEHLHQRPAPVPVRHGII